MFSGKEPIMSYRQFANISCFGFDIVEELLFPLHQNECFPFGYFVIVFSRSKISLYSDGLTYSHTMTPFDVPGKQAF